MSSNNNHLQENSASDDSETEDEITDLESSYRPISFRSDSDSDSESEPDNNSLTHPALHCNGRIPNPNPSLSLQFVSNGVSSFDLNQEDHDHEEEEEEEVEREREREASISRAFREDESRRRARLTADSASRIRDAMRGVSFPGFTPNWADQVPEDRWLEGLRRLRDYKLSSKRKTRKAPSTITSTLPPPPPPSQTNPPQDTSSDPPPRISREDRILDALARMSLEHKKFAAYVHECMTQLHEEHVFMAKKLDDHFAFNEAVRSLMPTPARPLEGLPFGWPPPAYYSAFPSVAPHQDIPSSNGAGPSGAGDTASAAGQTGDGAGPSSSMDPAGDTPME